MQPNDGPGLERPERSRVVSSRTDKLTNRFDDGHDGGRLVTDGGEDRWITADLDDPNTDRPVDDRRVVGYFDSDEFELGTDTESVEIPRSELRRALRYLDADYIWVVTNGERVAFADTIPAEYDGDGLSISDYPGRVALAPAIAADGDLVATYVEKVVVALDYATIPGDSDMVTVHVDDERPLFIEGDGGAIAVSPRIPAENPYSPDDEREVRTDGGVNVDEEFRCFGRCGKRFDSLDDMVAVPGQGNRDPRHFCEDCAERVRRGPPMADGGVSIDWPPAFDRTPTADRSRNRSFEVSLSDAFDDLEAELDRLGVDDYRYSFDAQQRKRDQRPYARASPDDPSFVLRWSMDGEQFAVACDRFSRLRDNVRTVGLYIREKRKMEQRPVTTGETEFANARLPSGDEAPVAADPPAHAVLGVNPDPSDSEVREAYRERVQEVHPDSGGDRDEFLRVKRAKEQLVSGGESA